MSSSPTKTNKEYIYIMYHLYVKNNSTYEKHTDSNLDTLKQLFLKISYFLFVIGV